MINPLTFEYPACPRKYACGVGLIWDAWHSMIEPLSSRIPYLVSMGNHEFVWAESYVQGHDSGGECGVPVEKRFRGPSNGEGILWYSFSSGPVHVVMLSYLIIFPFSIYFRMVF